MARSTGWFVQGYQEYLGLTRSSDHAREVTANLYRERSRKDPSTVRMGLQVENEYSDGVALVMYLHDAFGPDKVKAILTSEAHDFWTAVGRELDLNPQELVDGFHNWLRR